MTLLVMLLSSPINMSILLVLLSVGAVLIVGDFVARFLRPEPPSFTERMPLALALGSGFVALGIFYFSFLNNRYAVLLTLGASVLIIAMYGRKLLADLKYLLSKSRYMEQKSGLLITFVPLWFLFGLAVAVATATDLGFDGLINWGFKAQVAFVQGGWESSYFTDPWKQFTHQDYPLLVPSLETWAYTFLRSVDEQSIKIIFPLFYLSLLSLFYGALRSRHSIIFSLLFVLLLGSTPYLASLAAPSGYADVPLMLYTFAAIVFIHRWMEGGKNSDLAVGALVSALGVWAKREGIIYWLFNLLAILTWVWLTRNRHAPNRASPIIFFLLPAAMIIAPWFAFLAYYRVPTSDFAFSMVSLAWNRLPIVAATAIKQFFDIGLWGGLWVLFFIFSFLRRNSFHNTPDTYVWLGAFLPFLLLEASFLFSVWEPFTEHLALASERLCLQQVPIAWYWLALQSSSLDSWLNWVLPATFRKGKSAPISEL